MSDTSKNEWSEREIGALWKRDNGNQKYLTGKVKQADGTEQQVVIFKNKYKDKENQPDFRVYKSVDRVSASETETDTEEGTESQEEELL